MNNKTKLYEIINQEDWVIGGQNFDEDFHFSSFYIRLSSKKYLSKVNKPGYDTILAFYHNFNEIYYIPKSECERVSKILLEKILNEPSWMNSIIEEIYHRCDELLNVFIDYNLSSDFSILSNEEILNLYRKHFKALWNMYEVARIPEALDRGIEIFSNYLKNYLKDTCKTSDTLRMNELFLKLTTPVTPSIFQKELFEFLEIIDEIENNPGQKVLFLNLDQRLFFKINPIILDKIKNHKKKWGFIEYHGYSSRKLPDLDYYVNRISAYLKHSIQWKNYDEYNNWTKKIRNEQLSLFSEYSIDKQHQNIFNMYNEIGLAKLHRKFAQLTNFFFLDRLINQIALRTGHEEGLIRCLLPQEIEDLIEGKLIINNSFKNRMDFLIYLIKDEDEKIFSGVEYRQIKKTLVEKMKLSNIKKNELHGTPVSLGYAEGICKVIIRPHDAIRKDFKSGEIIVSESTDPDLIDLIAKCGGVVTQQGGVTSHASIICRELGKPAIVGINNLLENVEDYDEVILDAHAGKLLIKKDKRQNKWIIKSNEICPELLNRIGNKALKLGMLKKAGFIIPRFFIIPTDLFNMQNMDNNQDLLNEIIKYLNDFSIQKCAIRSSFLVEDDINNSKAGFFPSRINIDVSNIHEDFLSYVHELYDNYKEMPNGSIIIQEMICGDISGVCFTVDPLCDDNNVMVIEVVQGLNFKLTNGSKVPDIRLQIAKDSKEILNSISSVGEDLFDRNQIYDLLKILIEIEMYFGQPQDIEWTIVEGINYILQSRPITTIK